MTTKICVVAWKSHLPLLLRAINSLEEFSVKAYASTQLGDDPAKLEEAVNELKKADLAFFYRSNEGFWELIEKEVAGAENVPIVCIGHDPSLWTLSSAGLNVAARCYDWAWF